MTTLVPTLLLLIPFNAWQCNNYTINAQRDSRSYSIYCTYLSILSIIIFILHNYNQYYDCFKWFHSETDKRLYNINRTVINLLSIIHVRALCMPMRQPGALSANIHYVRWIAQIQYILEDSFLLNRRLVFHFQLEIKQQQLFVLQPW